MAKVQDETPNDNNANPTTHALNTQDNAYKSTQTARAACAIMGCILRPSSFYRTFGHYGIPLVIVTTVSMLWTMWLTVLNMDPNFAANALARTDAYDGGGFWMIVEPDATFKIIIVATLLIVVLSYMNVLRLLLFHDRSKEQSVLALIRSLSSTAENFTRSSKKDTKSMLYSAWKSVTGYEGKYRRIWNVFLKCGDLIMQSITLYRMMEDGTATELIYCCGVLISLNSLSCASLILFGRETSAISEIVLDSVFDMMTAVGFPLTSMLFAYYNLQLNHDELQLRMEAFNPGAFERHIRLYADPIKATRFRMSFAAKQITSFMDYMVDICINLAFCHRLTRLTLVLKRKAIAQEQRLKKPQQIVQKSSVPGSRVQARVPKAAAVIFLVTSAMTLYIPSDAISRSTAACSPHPQCVTYAYRWTSMDSCPCIGLVDVDRAIKTYEEWINPKDSTAIVRELARSHYLQIMMIVNRQLEFLPEELQYCTRLKALYLVYTGVTEIPDWFGNLENLEILHIEGRSIDTNLVKMDENAMKRKKWLTYFHLGVHSNLRSVPSLDDSKDLRFISLAYLFKLEKLPSFKVLHNLENFIVAYAPRLTYLPDMGSVRELSVFAVNLPVPVCCNGFMGRCNPSHPYCTGHSPSGVPPSPCLEENSPLKATPATLQLMAAHNHSICLPPKMEANPSTFPPTKANIEICNGTMFKECYVTESHMNATVIYPGICYPSRMRVIYCATSPYLIPFRKKQIALNIGAPCDKDVESWLGC